MTLYATTMLTLLWFFLKKHECKGHFFLIGHIKSICRSKLWLGRYSYKFAKKNFVSFNPENAIRQNWNERTNEDTIVM